MPLHDQKKQRIPDFPSMIAAHGFPAGREIGTMRAWRAFRHEPNHESPLAVV
jgi:hypothetical protein